MRKSGGGRRSLALLRPPHILQSGLPECRDQILDVAGEHHQMILTPPRTTIVHPRRQSPPEGVAVLGVDVDESRVRPLGSRARYHDHDIHLFTEVRSRILTMRTLDLPDPFRPSQLSHRTNRSVHTASRKLSLLGTEVFDESS